MSIQSRFVFKERPESGALGLRTVVLAEPEGDQVLVKIHSASICGTDLHIYKWNDWAARAYRPPFRIGHEFGGTVASIGPDVKGIKPGDNVTAETHMPCGHCQQCRLNRRHTCENLQLFSRSGFGCFSDHTLLPADTLRVVPGDIPIEVATIMEPFGVAVRAVSEAGVAGQRALVLGAGSIGLFTVLVARAYGASEVVAIDLSPARQRLAEEIGAHSVGGPDLLANLAQRFDAVIDTTGNIKAITEALDCVRNGGTMLLAGLPEERLPLDVTKYVVLREISIRGVYGRKLDETWILAERLLRTHATDAAKVITDRLPLVEFDRAFELAMSRRCGKVVLTPVGDC